MSFDVSFCSFPAAADSVHTKIFNPFKPNGISHCYQFDQSISVCYQLDKSISILRVVGWYFTFLFNFQ